MMNARRRAFALTLAIGIFGALGTTALAYNVYGKIGEKYNALRGALGAPLSDEADAPHGGRFNRFQHGYIYWHPKIGEAFAVYGAIGVKWASSGGPNFGYPITDERDVNRGRYNDFKAMHIAGQPLSSIYFRWGDREAFAVYGAIRQRWLAEGGATGKLGFPLSDEFSDRANNRRQTFEFGQIIWHDPRALAGKQDGSTEVRLGAPPPTSTAPAPTPPPTAQVPAEWADMLAAHNEKRRLHCAPPLAWSAQLAIEAQKHANLCSNSHGVPSGENLAFFSRSVNGQPVLPAKSDRAAYQDAWYCEIKQYDFNAPKFVGGFTQNCNPPVNGHFTQVVWKATQRIGCGRATCTINGNKGTYWVCRYDPPGNNTSVLTQNVLRATCN